MKNLGRWAAPLIVVVTLTLAMAGAAQARAQSQSQAQSQAQAQAQTGTVIKIRGIHPIHTHAQADRYLARTPERFRDFVVARTKVVQRHEQQAGGSPRCVRRTAVVVTRYHTSGYAVGGEGGCGGVATLYTDYHHGQRHGGAWRLIKATQDSFYCPVLKHYRVPSALVGTTCYSPSRDTVLPYHQG